MSNERFMCKLMILLGLIILSTVVLLTAKVGRSSIKRFTRMQPIGFFDQDEINRMSKLGKWLLSPEGSAPPANNDFGKVYSILIWKHGPFLERRHLRRFSNHSYSPWEGCSVSNCKLSYNDGDLTTADAVLFHLHLTKSPSDLPSVRRNPRQRWIFLTDESPLNTFLLKPQDLSDYNGLFNWSMSYRRDSDVPVPYGRTVPLSAEARQLPLADLRSKGKLVAVLGSNCGGHNERWRYVERLKAALSDKLTIFGRCLGGNTSACPGHFDVDCPLLNDYKFYLAFENSNCREYLTEKVFWQGYAKLAVPVVFGASRSDCAKLLPPKSYLHHEDFVDPRALANYMEHLDKHEDELLEYHRWRANYRVLNEHGYFGSPSVHYCRLCEALNYNSPQPKVYDRLQDFWSKRDCTK